MSKVIYRPLEKRDYPDIMEMIDNAWTLDKYADNPKSKDHMLKAFMHGSMILQNYTQIAELDGKAVGLLFGKVPKLKGYLKNAGHVPVALYHVLCLNFGKANRRVLLGMSNVQKSWARLRDDAGIPFDAELEFFIVHENSRGHGVGKTLLNNYLEFCKKNAVKNLYLYTDDNCNFGFYDHNGFRRAGSAPVCVELPGGKMEYNNYLYVRTVSPAP